MAGSPEELRNQLHAGWQQYIDMLIPFRPDLHRFCRSLTGNIWDAEDLAQEALLKAFAHWGVTYPEVRDVKAYLISVAANTWIDIVRRREVEARFIATSAANTEVSIAATDDDLSSAGTVRDAGARLLRLLSPQQRAAVVLKEVFDMSLEEIARLLATSTGAVKAALHRGRERLAEPKHKAALHRPPPSPELLDRFIQLFNAKDVNGMVALMFEGGVAENVGNSVHVGLDPKEGVARFLNAVVHGHPEWPAEFQYESHRVERGEVEGEPVLLFFVTRRGREALEVVMRLEEDDGKIARIRAYGFCPETIRAVGEVLGLRVRTGIYRAPAPAA
jgi:RNA polymerase sigma-70 factor, ECF subfamily